MKRDKLIKFILVFTLITLLFLSLIMIISGHETDGKTGLFIMVIGLGIQIFILYLYNRKSR